MQILLNFLQNPMLDFYGITSSTLLLICGGPITLAIFFQQLYSAHVIADLLTSIAYFSIPISLLIFVRKKKDISFKWLFVCFVLFITLCGITHLMHILQLLYPTTIVKNLDEFARVLTAIVSIGTAILLWRAIPKALLIPTPSQLEKANKEITYLAHHDVLTGLRNRNYFNDHIEKLIKKAKEDEKLAIIFIDLDRFKIINDTYGHEAGDSLLKQVASRLNSCIRKQDTASRQGGDEFIIVLDNVSDAETAKISNDMIKSISSPYFIQGNEIYCTPSLGVSLYPTDGQDAKTLIKHADLAMYKAKEMGKNTVQYFSEEMAATISNRLNLENQLRKALFKEELELYYQPQVDIKSNKIVSVEALLRWNHPEKGIVLPGEFISIAEETGLIVPIGEWVIREGCKQTKKWHNEGANLSISINLSHRQFMTDDIVSTVKSAIQDSMLDPTYLTLEITESLAIINMEETVSKLEELNEFGVNISLDDFGKGYSSLSYLSKLPIQQVKIDKSFIKEINNATKKEIINSINNIAHSLGISVVAEGVETDEQLKLVSAFDIDFAQGYFISWPVRASEIYTAQILEFEDNIRQSQGI